MKIIFTIFGILMTFCSGFDAFGLDQNEDSLCKLANASFAQSEADPKAIGLAGISYPHLTKLNDGMKNFSTSGLSVLNGQVVDWSKGDILVAYHGGDNLIEMFFPNSEPDPKSGKCDYPDYNKQTCAEERGGYIKVIPTPGLSEFTCPEDGYSSAWMKPEPNATYCVRTRDGKKYALMQIREICSDTNSVVFQWVKSKDRSFHADLKIKLQ